MLAIRACFEVSDHASERPCSGVRYRDSVFIPGAACLMFNRPYIGYDLWTPPLLLSALLLLRQRLTGLTHDVRQAIEFVLSHRRPERGVA